MRLYLDITSLSTNVLFLFQDSNLHLIVMLSYSLPTCDTPVVFSYPYNLDTFEEYWSFIFWKVHQFGLPDILS